MPDGSSEWVVPAALDGERVDRALALITGLSRREVNEVLSAGRVTVGRRPVGSRHRKVRSGEKLAVEGDLDTAPPGPPLADPSIEVPVVHCDADVVVVDKPPGLVVHPGHGRRDGTLVNGLLARFPDLALMATGEALDRPGIVHRLDKGTSGLLVVARTPAARADLVGQLSRRLMTREYLTLVHGRVDSDRGLIDAPLGRSGPDPGRVRVQSGGRPARTGYEVIGKWDEPAEVSLLRCRLETGRTHQIRVHLSSIGHPVVNDEHYGARKRSSWPPGWRQLPPGRPFLHAATLGFVHPVSGAPLSFSSPLPGDLRTFLEGIDPSRSRQV